MNNTKFIVVLGAGESGIGASVLALKKGFKVLLSDNGNIKPEYLSAIEKYNIPYEQNGHSQDLILTADEVIKSPGIPETAPLIVKLKEKNIPIISEIEFAARYTNAKKICITGSNGKTTTTELTYAILKNAGYNVAMAGNVGRSFALQVAEGNYDYYVIELSSFQLDNMYNFKAETAILLNITPDHLDRYNFSLDNYAASKYRIIQNQTPDCFFIYPPDDIVLKKLNNFKSDACYIPVLQNVDENNCLLDNDNVIVKYNNGKTVAKVSIKDMQLKGNHNVINAMSAIAAAVVNGVDIKSIEQTIANFKPLEHRIEYAGQYAGRTFINDSKGTNVDAVYRALESCNAPIVLILGGVDKGNNYQQLYPIVGKKVRAIVAMGKDNSRIISAFRYVKIVFDTHSLDECIKKCLDISLPGDTILLSPACASFDLFTCYEDRGEQFKNAVKQLNNK